MNKHGNMDKYYKKVWRALNCSSCTKKKILNNLKSDIEEYLEDYPNITEQEIIEKFGEPEKYAEAYISSMNNIELKKCFSINKFVKKFGIIIGLLVVLILIITVVIIISQNTKESTQYYSESITYSINYNN